MKINKSKPNIKISTYHLIKDIDLHHENAKLTTKSVILKIQKRKSKVIKPIKISVTKSNQKSTKFKSSSNQKEN